MKIRFGMLATDAYGKAGGQCIQRRGSIRVLRNITIPTERSASISNPQRLINSRVFSGWAQLTSEQRQEWANVGANITTKNGWGEERTLTGREAFSRLNGIWLGNDNTLIDPTTVNFAIPISTISGIVINTAALTMVIPTSLEIGVSFYQMKALKLSNKSQNPLINKLRTYARVGDLSDSSDNYDQLFLNFGAISVGTVFNIAIRPVNESGITGVWTQLQVTAI